MTSLVTPDLLPGQKWSFEYDSDGDLRTSTTPLGEQETYTHNPQRDLTGVTDRAGRPTAFSYDQLGRRSSVTDPVGRFGVFGYSTPTSTAWSGPTLYAQSPSNTAAPTGVKAALADGQYQIGTNGFQPGADTSHVALYRDATFQLSQWVAADALQRTTGRSDRSAGGLPFDSTTPGAGQVSGHPPFVDESYDYSAAGSPAPLAFISETNDAYLTNHFWGGELGRNPNFEITSIGHFLGLAQQFYSSNFSVSRDVAGRLTGVSNASSPSASSITYLPNGPVGNVALVTPMPHSANTGSPCAQGSECPTLSCNGTPDKTGKCLVYSVVQQSEGETFAYDARGLLQTRSLSFSNATPGGDFQYHYDQVGRNIRLIYPDGHERDQAFDALGRLTSRCYLYTDGTAAHCFNATYDAVGNPKILTDPDMREEIEYDDLDRVTEVRRYLPADATVPAYVESYAYNALGGFAIYDGVVMDDQRPRLDGAGKASAGIPATLGGQPVTLDAAGRVTSFNNQTFQYYNQHHRLETFTAGNQKQTYSYDALERLIGVHYGPPSDIAPTNDENFLYSDLSSSFTAIVNTNFNTNVPPNEPPLPNTIFNAGYDGVDHPLWYTSGTTLIYPELDAIGNVRRLHVHPDPQNPSAPEIGTFGYSAFGKSIAVPSAPGGIVGGNPRFTWQGKRQIGTNLYDSRARVWSADLGVFLQPDEYGFLTPTGTLWSWPGQNPFRWRDPSGRAGEIEDGEDDDEDPTGDGLPFERLAPIPAGETNLQLAPEEPWVEELNRSLSTREPRAGDSNDPGVECKDGPAAERTWADVGLESGATRRLATQGDTQFGTDAHAIAEALERYGIDPSTVEITAMYGKNANLIGPNGQPWEIVRGLNSDGDIVEFEHHASGHYFDDTDTYELPHYHGPNGEHLTY